MPDWLPKSLAHGHELPFDLLFYRLYLAFALGCAVAGIYYLTHRRRDECPPGFLSTLVLLSILIAVVTQVIGDSVARAFSLAGALAIVRFRTVVEDSRDTAFVIFAVITGMAVGADYSKVALAGLVVAGMAAFVVRPRAPVAVADWTLTVRLGIGGSDTTLETLFREHLEEFTLLASGTGRQGAVLDLTYRVRLRPTANPTTLVAELNKLEHVQQVELRRL
jgi:Domain of unknown function (DUF4956)